MNGVRNGSPASDDHTRAATNDDVARPPRQTALPGVLLLLPLVIGLGCRPDAAVPPSPDPQRDAQAPAQAQAPAPAFELTRLEADVPPFEYRNGEEAGEATMLESLGGGLALFDYDRDGDLDLFCPGGGKFTADKQVAGRPSALLRHKSPWKFHDVSRQALPVLPDRYTHGVAVADYDNDGFPDVLLTGYSGATLLKNQGDGRFTEVTSSARLIDLQWSSSAAWADLNGDGALDVYLAHYVDWSFENHPYCSGPFDGQREVCPPAKFASLADSLFTSRGDGTFQDVSGPSGLRQDGKGLGVLAGDLDLDGDTDLYVTNDGFANFLYENDGAGKLTEIGAISGTALSDTGHRDGSMGVDAADYDLDGLPDLWVANFESEAFALYHNDGQFAFRHVSAFAGITAVGGAYVGWGSVFGDFDRDGDEDIFTANGHVVLYPRNAPRKQPPLVFENQRGKRFRNVAANSGAYAGASHLARGVAMGDLDRDGDLDLVVSHINAPLAVLRNDSQNQRCWLAIRLVGVFSNRDAIGAVVRVKAAGTEQLRLVKGGGSYASTSDRTMFVGLDGCRQVDGIEVRWPSGTVQTVLNVRANQVLTITEARDGRGS